MPVRLPTLREKGGFKMSASQPQPKPRYLYRLDRRGFKVWRIAPGSQQPEPVFSLDISQTRALVFALYYYSLDSASSTGTFIPATTIFSSLQDQCPLLKSLGIKRQHLIRLLHYIWSRPNGPSLVTARRGPNGGFQLYPDLSGYLHKLLEKQIL